MGSRKRLAPSRGERILERMNVPPSVAEKHFSRAQGEFVRTELELGDTLLDMAQTTQDAAFARSCMRSALTALQTADKHMAGALFLQGDLEVRDLRKRLATGLREAFQSSRPCSMFAHGPREREAILERETITQQK